MKIELFSQKEQPNSVVSLSFESNCYLFENFLNDDELNEVVKTFNDYHKYVINVSRMTTRNDHLDGEIDSLFQVEDRYNIFDWDQFSFVPKIRNLMLDQFKDLCLNGDLYCKSYFEGDDATTFKEEYEPLTPETFFDGYLQFEGGPVDLYLSNPFTPKDNRVVRMSPGTIVFWPSYVYSKITLPKNTKRFGIVINSKVSTENIANYFQLGA